MLLFYHIVRLFSRNSLWIPGGEIKWSKWPLENRLLQISDKGEKHKYQWVIMTHWFFGTLAEAFSLITEAQFLRFVFKSSKCGLALVSRPQNEALKSGRAETLWANRQNVGKASPDIFSLPFIRNHDFARNSTKCWIFKAFGVFSKAFHEILKKETVNSSLKNAILCLNVIWANQADYSAKAFSLNTATRFLRGKRKRWAFLLTALRFSLCVHCASQALVI